MAKFLLLLLLTNYLSFEVVTSEDPADKSYLKEVHFHYFPNSGEWNCGGHNCPENTKGCHAQIKNDKKNELFLNVIYQCFYFEKPITKTKPSKYPIKCDDIQKCTYTEKIDYKIKLSKRRKVSIDLISYVGATKTKFLKTVSKPDGTEIAEAIIKVNGLAKYKEKVAYYRQQEKNLHGYGLGR